MPAADRVVPKLTRVIARAILFGACAVLSANAQPAPPKAARARAPDEARVSSLPEVDALVEAAIADAKLPGAVVAIGRRNGIVFMQAYGSRAVLPAREVMTTDSVFDLASLTKPVSTATLVMQLSAAGSLDLDAPVKRYLPALATWNRGRPTLRQLLIHASGLPPVAPLKPYPAGLASALTQIAALRPAATPGERFAYSDLGFISLGAIVERVASEPLAIAARERLFEPLGMRDTGYLPDAVLSPRIAPTERIDARRAAIVTDSARNYGVIRGQVHDPRAFRLGGVAGHAGVFSTAEDLARFARMLLGHGELDGVRILPASAVDQMTTPHIIGDDVRALGWDMRTRYSGLRGSRLSAHAFGHGGFTGTSLWIDPDRDLFVIFLSNRVHPDGKGHVIPLAGAIADVAATRIPLRPAAYSCSALPRTVLTGIDVLRRDGFTALAGQRIGLIVHNASRARDGALTLSLLSNAPGVTLGALFAPEHGLASDSEGAQRDTERGGVPVYSLFGKTRKPTAKMLRGLTALVFDLADVGVRFYTYMSTLRYVLEAAAEAKLDVYVLDRPNPLGAEHADGPVLAEGIETFVNYHRLPVTHGMTAGELADLLNTERKIGAKLHVIPMQGYARDLQWADTDLRWYAPSPNLPTPDAALLYPATGLLESSHLSVGRGTPYPFAFVGAPWLDGQRLAAALSKLGLPGVAFEPVTVTPTSDRHRGKVCSGVRLTLTDRRGFRPVLTGLSVAHEVLAQAGDAFHAEEIGPLVAEPTVVSALAHGTAPADLERLWEMELQRFEVKRRRHLRYAYCE